MTSSGSPVSRQNSWTSPTTIPPFGKKATVPPPEVWKKVFSSNAASSTTSTSPTSTSREPSCQTCHFVPKLLRKRQELASFTHFSDYPLANRDLALVMDASIPAGQVLTEIERAANQACPQDFSVDSVAIFDHYQGEHLEDGKKSLAFAIQYRSTERTLKEKEVNNAFENLTQAMTTETPYELR